MADFNYFLNRQGVRGLQGVKGDQGDSPIITVQTETPNEYILKITNPDGTELISPNLRGNKININEGTYVRYNTETGELYTSTADGATGELAGVVRLATDADITNMDERTAVTPSQLADALSQYLVSPDGSVKIVQNTDNSLTELTAKGGLTELPIASADTLGAVKIGENLSITEDGTLTANDSNYIKTTQVSKGGLGYGVYLNSSNGNKLDTIQPKFNTFDGALETHSILYLKAATYSASEPADEDMVSNWTDKNGFFTGGNSPTGFISGSVKFVAGSGSLQVVFKLMEAGYISGIDQNGRYKFSKIEISTDGTTYTEYNNTTSNAKYIRFTFDYNFTSITFAEFSTRIKTTFTNIAGGYSVPLSVKVDNSTIQIVDDKLHVNFDEINGEISDVSSRVTTLETQVGDISTTLDSNTTDIEGLKETKNNNIFDIGNFTVVGSLTITDDGIASGFTTSNYLTTKDFIIGQLSGKSWTIHNKFYADLNEVPSYSYGINDIINLSESYHSYGYMGMTNLSSRIMITTGITGSEQNYYNEYAISQNGWVEQELSFDVNTGTYTFKHLVPGDSNWHTSTWVATTENKELLRINVAPTDKIKIGRGLETIIGYGSIDLKSISITVDGKEIFNGLMNSTKPIYDAIKANDTELSEFKVETSNDFSAVNSALNEKANLSDLSKCASLADFNRLSATVTVLEGQVGDVSSVLDNINGEVI